MASEARDFQTIARQILVQICSISSCEQNWNIYSFVYNKVRNCLQPSCGEDLVYIYTKVGSFGIKKALSPFNGTA